MKKFLPVTMIAVLALVVAQFAFSHCEVPMWGSMDD